MLKKLMGKDMTLRTPLWMVYPLRKYENTIDVNAKDSNGYAVLHYAMFISRDLKQSNDTVMSKLLQWDSIDINLPAEKMKYTPLDLAILSFSEKSVAMLLEHGVNVEISKSAEDLLNNTNLPNQAKKNTLLSSIKAMLKSATEDNKSNAADKFPKKRTRMPSTSDEADESPTKRAKS